jgi:hypothetical protein
MSDRREDHTIVLGGSSAGLPAVTLPPGDAVVLPRQTTRQQAR